jgi:hypothetical protein
MPFTYKSGQEIKKGDRVLYHDEPGEIELVADPRVSDAEVAWYINEYGGGVLVIEPKIFGRVFISDVENDEDLIFVSRQE